MQKPYGRRARDTTHMAHTTRVPDTDKTNLSVSMPSRFLDAAVVDQQRNKNINTTAAIQRDYLALAKGFPALALMSESDLAEDFEPFAAALEAALDPIVADFRRQMVRCIEQRS